MIPAMLAIPHRLIQMFGGSKRHAKSVVSCSKGCFIAMTVIMHDVIALVFQCVNTFVFSFPAAAACLCYVDDIRWMNGDVCYPTVGLPLAWMN